MVMGLHDHSLRIMTQSLEVGTGWRPSPGQLAGKSSSLLGTKLSWREPSWGGGGAAGWVGLRTRVLTHGFHREAVARR